MLSSGHHGHQECTEYMHACIHPNKHTHKWLVPVITALGTWRQGDQGCKIILSYVATQRPAWVTRAFIPYPKPGSVLSQCSDFPMGGVRTQTTGPSLCGSEQDWRT